MKFRFSVANAAGLNVVADGAALRLQDIATARCGGNPSATSANRWSAAACAGHEAAIG